MTTHAGEMSNAAQTNPQWLPCDGAYISGYKLAGVAARPSSGVSTGTVRDYWRRVYGFARTRGIGGFMLGMPYDPTSTWKVSIADDSSEADLTNPPTVAKPPAGVR